MTFTPGRREEFDVIAEFDDYLQSKERWMQEMALITLLTMYFDRFPGRTIEDLAEVQEETEIEARRVYERLRRNLN